MAPATLGELSVPLLGWSVTHSTWQPVPAHRDSERSVPPQSNLPVAEILLSTWESRNQSQSHLLPTGRASIRVCAGTWKSPPHRALQSSQAQTRIYNAQAAKSQGEGQGVRLLCRAEKVSLLERSQIVLAWPKQMSIICIKNFLWKKERQH